VETAFFGLVIINSEQKLKEKKTRQFRTLMYKCKNLGKILRRSVEQVEKYSSANSHSTA
jgi:hypothetical protein